MLHNRAAACVGGSLVAVLLFAGCTSLPSGRTSTAPETGSAPAESASPVPVDTDFNSADLEFVTTLIQRQQEAIELVKTFRDKPDVNEEVSKLAADTQSSLEAELEELRGWLEAWGRTMNSLPPTDKAQSALNALKNASGLQASRLFLDTMIELNQEAIVAAENQLDDGKYEAANTMAASLIEERTAQVTAMHDLKESL